MKPRVSILMITSLDGSLHPSRFTASVDGTLKDWYGEYEKVHSALQANAWLVGRVTMAEMSKVGPHPPSDSGAAKRPLYIAAKKDATSFAVAIDWSGKLHFQNGFLSGDHVIVLLGPNVPDEHLAELAADEISYIVSSGISFDILDILEILAQQFNVSQIVVEGGARTNGFLLASGVVDELRILVVPALEGAAQVQTIISHPGGLSNKVKLKFKSARPLAHGVVEMLYGVLSDA